VPLERTCEYDFTSVIFFTGLALDLALGQSSLNHKKPENLGHKKVAENKTFKTILCELRMVIFDHGTPLFRYV
jgi:hypothetical protein